MGAVYKRKRRCCGICKASKRGLEKRERKGKGTIWTTRQDDRLAARLAAAGMEDAFPPGGPDLNFRG
jgi:hypothetical protein